MENFEKPNQEKGTHHWYRFQNPDGTVSSFETKEELDEHIEKLREEK